MSVSQHVSPNAILLFNKLCRECMQYLYDFADSKTNNLYMWLQAFGVREIRKTSIKRYFGIKATIVKYSLHENCLLNQQNKAIGHEPSFSIHKHALIVKVHNICYHPISCNFERCLLLSQVSYYQLRLHTSSASSARTRVEFHRTCSRLTQQYNIELDLFNSFQLSLSHSFNSFSCYLLSYSLIILWKFLI